MIIFPCHVCQTPLSAEDSQVGQLVRCPVCATTLRTPAQSIDTETASAVDEGAALYQQMQPPSGQVGAATTASGGVSTFTMPPPPATRSANFNPYNQGAGFRSPGRRYGFNCGYCSSRLEATESMAAQDGQCPTCGNNITIPILDRYNRLIDPKTRQIIKQDPHPVHAYAAAGERAPKILRRPDGQQNIQCPRCGAVSPITANNCRNCGMPFTMEGTTIEATSNSNGFCVASLVLGIIGIPACMLIIPAALAVIFGVVGINQSGKDGKPAGGKGMAIAGIVCGTIGLLIAGAIFLH